MLFYSDANLDENTGIKNLIFSLNTSSIDKNSNVTNCFSWDVYMSPLYEAFWRNTHKVVLLYAVPNIAQGEAKFIFKEKRKAWLSEEDEGT